MRIALRDLELQLASGPLPLRFQLAALEATEAGEWRLLLQGLKADALTLLEDLFAHGEVAQVRFTTTEGDRTAGMVRVARLSLGNVSTAVLQGLSTLP